MSSLFILNVMKDMGDNISKQFSNTIPTSDILLSLLIAIISVLIIDFTYKKTYVGVSYAKTFSLSIILLALVTSIVIRTINANLSLSLGMVGALSIVRFRTAVKDPVDTIFMFWAITVGIMSGAGLYIVTIFSTIIISMLYFLSYSVELKRKSKMLLIVTCNIDKSKEIIKKLENKKKCILKTEMYKNKNAELTYEFSNRKDVEPVLSMNGTEGIKAINIIDID